MSPGQAIAGPNCRIIPPAGEPYAITMRVYFAIFGLLTACPVAVVLQLSIVRKLTKWPIWAIDISPGLLSFDGGLWRAV